MFWISKRKGTFNEVWQDGFVDIHNHLLPGIDDGSKSIIETESMIIGMQELGITETISTPHTYPGLYQNDKKSITAAYNSLSTNFITGYSSEYFADAYLLELAKQNALIPLKDDYLLIEFSLLSAPVDAIMDMLFALKLKDYRLILAHPERYLYWEKDLSVFEQLKSFDLDFQLNVLSLLGYYGNPCKKMSDYLLENDFYDFLGTDFHSLEQIDFTKNHTFSEKFLKKIATLVQSNQQFRSK